MAATRKANIGSVLESASSLATIIAAVVAIFAFYYGYKQFHETQKLQREALEIELESQAIDLNFKYNELMRDAKTTDQNFWRDNLGVSIAESVFRLRKPDEGWKNTAKWMLSNHKEYLDQGGLKCNTFDSEFVELMKEFNREVCEK
jgi:hypothetical protein